MASSRVWLNTKSHAEIQYTFLFWGKEGSYLQLMTETWGPKEWEAEEVTSQCRVILSYPVLCDSSTWPGTPSDAVQGNIAGQGTFLNSLVLSHNSPTKKQQPEMDSQHCTWPLPCVEENRTEILERPAHKGAGARLMFLVPFIDHAVMEFTAQDLFFFKLYVCKQS